MEFLGPKGIAGLTGKQYNANDGTDKLTSSLVLGRNQMPPQIEMIVDSGVAAQIEATIQQDKLLNDLRREAVTFVHW